MKTSFATSALLLALGLGACSNSDPKPVKEPVTEVTPVTSTEADNTCSCDQFPFPKACASKCEAQETVIQSVNTADKTAVVQIQKAGATVNETVALSSLPHDLPVEKGASFTALSKKDLADPAKSRIVAFTKKLK
jgi:hypothetical protein